ncbi:unnamed protein product, partial [Allacma fusca]
LQVSIISPTNFARHWVPSWNAKHARHVTEWLSETIQAIVTLGDFNTAHQTLLPYKCLSEDQKDFDLAIIS